MEGFLVLVWIVSLIYETYCVYCIKDRLSSGLSPLPIGGAFFYFVFNLVTIGFYGIYWCVKAEEHLLKIYEVRRRSYPKTNAWQWYFFGSLIIVGPFIAFSALKSRVENINNIEYTVDNNSSNRINNSIQASIQNNDTKVCPYCAETIKKKAIVCRFCGREISVE